MSDLTRTRSGNFYIEDSIKINDFKDMVSKNKLNEILLPVEKVLSNYKTVNIDSKAEKFVLNGNKISVSYIDEKDIKETKVVAKFNNRVVGVYEVLGDFIKPITMLI